MTNPRWILPTISTIAALAVAVGGALIGSTFASHDTNLVSSGTQTVAVLAPVSTGSAPDDANAVESDEAIPVSDAVAEREVRRPGSDPEAIDPALLDVIDALTDAPDPAVELMILDEGDGGVTGSDDPCAPRDGSDPSDCPDGLRSSILPLIALRDFAVSGKAFPPTESELVESGSSAGQLWCDGLTASDTSVPFGILATAPGTFSLSYWPSAHRDRVVVADDVITATADQRQFEDAVITAASTADIPLLRHCLTLADLEPETAYTAVVSGTDIFDRTSRPYSVRFHTGGAPHHPGAQIVTIGENLVFVSALHPADERVDIRAVVTTSDATPGCSALSVSWSLPSLTETETRVNLDELLAVNAPLDFSRKRVATWAVPEGSTMLVCARWYQAGGAASWATVQPLYESSAILQAPDRVNPRLELTRVSPYGRGLESIDFTVSTAEGVACWHSIWSPGDAADSLPRFLCDTSGVAAPSTGSARVDTRGFLSDRGSSGDLVVRMLSSFAGGASVETSVLIPSVDRGCRGVCSLPGDAWYEVALGSVGQPGGLCGSSFGDCTPPTRTVSAGSVQLKALWSQGAMNGREDWSVTPTVDFAPDYVLPDEAQFDQNQRWTFDDVAYPLYSQVPQNYVAARFTLAVDRPVDYTLRFTDGPPGVASERCDLPGAPLEVSGHTDDSVDIRIPGACLGALYYAELILVDAAGNRVAWNFIDRSHFWSARASNVRVPGATAELRYDVYAQGFMRSALTEFSLTLGYDVVSTEDTRSGQCTLDGIVESHGSLEVDLNAQVYVRLQLRIRAADHWETDDCRGFSRESEDTGIVEAVIPLADLYRPEGVTITAPEAYGARITLHAYRP